MTLSNDIYQARKAGDSITREMEEAAEALESRITELEALVSSLGDNLLTADNARFKDRALVDDCAPRLNEIRAVVNLAADTPISDTILEILNRPYIWSRGYP
jgi:hypothetical protein